MCLFILCNNILCQHHTIPRFLLKIYMKGEFSLYFHLIYWPKSQITFHYKIFNYQYLIRQYMFNYQQQTFLQDYLHALKNPIANLNKLIRQQFTSLQQTFDINFSKKMSVIIEQQTERENQDNQSQINNLRRNFNHQIKSLFKIKEDLQQILSHYKRQLQKIAVDFVKTQQIKKNLQQKLKQATQIVKSKQKDEKQLKRSRKVNKQKDFQKQKYKMPHKQSKNNIQDQLQIRKAPSPLKENACSNCLKLQEDKNRWKILANKIEQVKKKNSIFEQQLKMKQQQIVALKQNIVQIQKKLKDQKEEQQKKKLKKDNTTLRGEKVLMANQIGLLKKQLNEKIQLGDIQELQIKKLRIQIQNINSSLNWHVTNLHQIRNSHHKTLTKEQKDQLERVQLLNKQNRYMIQLIMEQQKQMQDINNKTKKIEDGFEKYTQRYIKRMSQLENMLQDKNETIMRLKTNGVGLKSDKNGNYQSQMIRLLNKKLTQKEQKIRNLEQKLEMRISEHINQQQQ